MLAAAGTVAAALVAGPAALTETTTTLPTSTIGATRPDASSLISATPDSNRVSLSWTTPPDGNAPILWYRLYRGTSAGGETS